MKQQLITLTATISPTGQQALATLPAAERSIIEAALSDKIKDLPAVKAVNEIITILLAVYTIAGQKSDPATLAIYADEFYQKMLASFPFITIEEIAHSLKKGVYDEFGEYYGLNVKSFVFFVRSYLQSEERQTAKNIFEAKLLSPAPAREETPEQKEQTKREFVNELYRDFLDNNLITDYIPSYLCGFLEEKHLIVLNNGEKTAIKDRARSYYQRMVAQGRLQTEMGKVARAGMASKDPDTRISNIARQFAIYEFFDRCREQGAAKIFGDTDENI